MVLPLGPRSLLVAVSPQLAALSLGGCITYPTVLMHQLKANDSSIQIDMNTATWIGSMYGIAGIPAIAMPLIMQWKGRKLTYIMSCLFLVIGWIVSVIATNTTWILVSESFHGLATNSLLLVSFTSMTEMMAPKYRFINMQIFGITLIVGSSITGILGHFLHYKVISLIMLVPACVAVGIACFWPESPPWFAWRGEFDKCEKAFLWLRGTDDVSIKELKELIAAQKENLGQTKTKPKLIWSSFWTKVTRRDFYKPAFHMFVLLNMMYWSGVDFILIYIIEMVQKSTQSADAPFYVSIAVYIIFVVGALLTNITVRKFNLKTVLLCSTCGVILFLLGACSVTFLQSEGLLPRSSLLCTFFLIGYVSFATLGLNGVVFLIASELMPVKHRSFGGALYIVFNCGLYASNLKLTPYLIVYIQLWGMFLLFAVNAILCSLFVWKYVPETKGKTLQELEDFYMYGNFTQRNLMEDSEPMTKNLYKI